MSLVVSDPRFEGTSKHVVPVERRCLSMLRSLLHP